MNDSTKPGDVPLPTSRREFVGATIASAIGLSLGGRDGVPSPIARRPSSRAEVDVRRAPDLVAVQTDTTVVRLQPSGSERWTADDLVVTTTPGADALTVTLAAPRTAVRRVHFRWRGSLADVRLVAGDAWERGYGDLEWRGLAPDRVMPWYVATTDGSRTTTYGVRTGARALCAWQVDSDGVSLWADVRSGGVGVQLGPRTLHVCDVLARPGRDDESAFAALRAFCGQLCATPRLPAQPVYGHNDWYWAYGDNSARSVLDDAHRIVELAPTGSNRPIVVIDDGWQPGRGRDRAGAGTWDRGNEKFPDMARLAADVRQAGARPGIWIRPLEAPERAPDGWRLPREHASLDPTVPEVRQKIVDDVARLRQWGFDLVKHDYSTWDILGRWGFQMEGALTRDGWTFAEGPRRTTAEVIDDLYAAIRGAAGDGLVIGCNTISHLSAGRFEMCRIGDDTSGTEWPRTRKMGVNSLAFRAAQQGTFYVADPDCAPVTTHVPWTLARQWLDLVARSGTMCFVSIAADALGAAERRDVVAALALAAAPQPLAEPLDWERTLCPSRWRVTGGERSYDWIPLEGAGLG